MKTVPATLAAALVFAVSGCTAAPAEPMTEPAVDPAETAIMEADSAEPASAERIVFFNKTIYFGNDPTGAPQNFSAPLEAGYDNVTVTLTWHYTGVSASNNLYLRVYDPNGERVYGNGFGISLLATGNPHSRTTAAVTGTYVIEAEGWGTHSVALEMEAFRVDDPAIHTG